MIVKEYEEYNLPVNDVVLMAVVDARKNLLHKDSTVSFGEFAALQNFIEELSSCRQTLRMRSLHLRFRRLA